MIINEFRTMVDNWKLAAIEPRKKDLSVFLTERVKQIKQAQSSAYNEAKISKAIKEQSFVNAIIDLTSEYDLFMDYVKTKMEGFIIQYADFINKGASLREENEFLRERLSTMDEREKEYIKIISKLSKNGK